MRVGDFHIVDALRGVVDGDGKYRNRAQVVTADRITYCQFARGRPAKLFGEQRVFRRYVKF